MSFPPPRHRCSRGNRIDVTLLSELSGSCQIRRASHFPSGWLQKRRDASASPRGLDLNKPFSDLQFLHPILWCGCFAQLVLIETNEKKRTKNTKLWNFRQRCVQPFVSKFHRTWKCCCISEINGILKETKHCPNLFFLCSVKMIQNVKKKKTHFSGLNVNT